MVRIFLKAMPLEFAVDGGVAPTKISSHFLWCNAGKKKIFNLAAFLFREMRHYTSPKKFVRLNALPPPGRGNIFSYYAASYFIIQFCKTKRTFLFL